MVNDEEIEHPFGCGALGTGARCSAGMAGRSVRDRLGAGDEKLLIDAIKVLEEKGVKAVALPPTSLDALAAYMLEADVVLSGDTGPLHLARSLRRPIVAFFRVGDGGRWCPTGHHIRRFSWGQDCFQEQWDQ